MNYCAVKDGFEIGGSVSVVDLGICVRSSGPASGDGIYHTVLAWGKDRNSDSKYSFY